MSSLGYIQGITFHGFTMCSVFHAVVQVGFDPTVYAVDEDAGLVNLRIVKLTTAGIPVSVNLSTVDGSATGECF